MPSAFLQTDTVKAACKVARMQDHRQKIRKRIEAVLAETGFDATRLAKEAGISHTTLTRFLYNPDYPSTPTSTTLAKIEAVMARFRASHNTQEGAAVASFNLPDDTAQDEAEVHLLISWRRLSDKNKTVVASLIANLLDDTDSDGFAHQSSLVRIHP